MKKYLLEFGHSYKEFDSIKELDKFRRERNIGNDGVLYTHDGHLVNEEKAREMEDEK